MKITLAVIIALLLPACSSNPPAPFPGPHGRAAYGVRCGGTLGNSLERCYRRAAELCPSGYTVVDRTSEDSAVEKMVVECKA